METWRLTIEPWRVYREVVADCHHFDEEQDLDPHWSEKLDQDPQHSNTDQQLISKGKAEQGNEEMKIWRELHRYEFRSRKKLKKGFLAYLDCKIVSPRGHGSNLAACKYLEAHVVESLKLQTVPYNKKKTSNSRESRNN